MDKYLLNIFEKNISEREPHTIALKNDAGTE